MKVEKLEVLKVGLANEYYILIIPNDEYGMDGFRDFFLASEMFEGVIWMLACEVENDDEAVRIAVNEAPEFIEYYREELFEDEIS